MTISLTCKHCRTEITAEDEDELVPLVQDHSRGHDPQRELSREHILARLHRQQRARTD